jgi:hypothetical protein
MPRLAVIAFVLAIVVLYLWRGQNRKAAAVAAGASKPVEPDMAGHAVPRALARPAKAATARSPGYDPTDAPPSQEQIGVAYADGSYSSMDDVASPADRYRVNAAYEDGWATLEE